MESLLPGKKPHHAFAPPNFHSVGHFLLLSSSQVPFGGTEEAGKPQPLHRDFSMLDKKEKHPSSCTHTLACIQILCLCANNPSDTKCGWIHSASTKKRKYENYCRCLELSFCECVWSKGGVWVACFFFV